MVKHSAAFAPLPTGHYKHFIFVTNKFKNNSFKPYCYLEITHIINQTAIGGGVGVGATQKRYRQVCEFV